MAAMQLLEDEIKQLIIDALQLEDIAPTDIEADAPLFVSFHFYRVVTLDKRI